MVSASVSPTTEEQISHAEEQGFVYIPFNANSAADPEQLLAERQRVLAESLVALSNGQDVIVASARGPDDSAVDAMTQAAKTLNVPLNIARDRLGAALGDLVADIRKETGLPRIVIAGGDTSGHALTALGGGSTLCCCAAGPRLPTLSCAH